MAETCRETCPIMIYCRSQEVMARAIVSKLTDLHLVDLDRYNSLPEDAPERDSKELANAVAAASALVNHTREMVEVISSGVDQRLKIADEQCDKPYVQHLGPGGLVLTCGGFDPQHVQEMNGDQVVIDRIGRMVGFVD